MAQFKDLKNAIIAVIKQNGNNEITGQLLQNALLSMINSLGGHCNFAGVVTPTFVPPVDSDERIFYLASAPGVYTNFGETVVVNPGEIRYFAYDGVWGTGAVMANILQTPTYTAVLCTNETGAGYYTWKRTNNKDTITLRGSWFLLLSTDGNTSNRVYYLCKTDQEKTFEITPGIGIWVNTNDLKTLANNDIIPDDMYNSGVWYKSNPTPNRILLYHQWYENAYGLIPECLGQKEFLYKQRNDSIKEITAYVKPSNIVGANRIDPPFLFSSDALVSWSDDFSGSLTWTPGYIDRTGNVNMGYAGYLHSNMFPINSETLKISFASTVTFALYDESQTFLNTVGTTPNAYDWEYDLPSNVKYVIANLESKYFLGGSEYVTHPAYLQWREGNMELFDGYMDRTGVVKPNENYKHTPLIRKQSNYIKINFASDETIALYNSNQQIIGMLGTSSNVADWVTFIPENVAYIVANIHTVLGTQPPYLYWGAGDPVYEINWLSFNGILRNNIRGRKWVSLGDSITFQNKWQPILVDLFGLIHTNCGIGSTTLAGQRTNAFWQDVRLNAVKTADPDIVTILGGANDIVYNVPIGTDDDFNNMNVDTFLGAYAYIINNLLTWKPLLRIVLLGTTWAHEDGRDLSGVTTGLTYTDYSNATKKVAQYYGLKFADLHGETGFNKYTQSAWFPDGIHPNDAGGAQIASIVVPEFDKLIF